MKMALALAMGAINGLGDAADGRERPIDRLGALAMAQSQRVDEAAWESFMASLGGDLIAFKYGNRADMEARAVEKLSLALSWGIKLGDFKRTRVAKQAVHEFSVDFCATCKSAGEVPELGLEDHDGPRPMKPCGDCGGSGRRRWTDSERIACMGDKLEKPMEEAHRLIAWAEWLIVTRSRERLER